MSSIKSFLDETFFMSGAEGIVLFAVCIAAVVCTLVVIAMTVVVVVTLKRRRGEASAVSPVQEAQPPAEEPAEVLAEIPAEEPAEETEEALAEVPAEEPVEAPAMPAAVPVIVPIVPAAAFTGSRVRYNKSFTARLIQSSDEVKKWYAGLKNELLSYKKVKARMSWKRESFRLGRTVVARFGYRGSTLCIYLPLDPAEYEGTKYRVEDTSVYVSYADTPCLYRLRGARRARYAAELIAAWMDARGVVRVGREAEEYDLPYEDNEPLIERGLIKVVGRAAGEGDLQVPAKEPAAEGPEEPVAEENAEAHPVLPFDRNGSRYNMSFAAKLIQSDDAVKNRYAELRDELLSYKRVKARRSWKRESYHFGRRNVVRFSFRGKTLCVYFALEPDQFEGAKYKVESIGGSASYADTPCLYRMKSDRRVRYAKVLIAMVMARVGAEKNLNYAPEGVVIPYEETEVLIAEGLIKIEGETPREPFFQAAREEAASAEVPEEVLVEEEAAPEEQPIEEEVPEEEEAPEEEPIEEPTEEEPSEEPAEEPIEEAEVEELSAQELDDVQSYEEAERDEDGIEVVGVMFRRRGRKVYWFDPDGRTWKKGEIALYITPDDSPQEVIVMDNAKISPGKLHLPLKPLHKATIRPQTEKE